MLTSLILYITLPFATFNNSIDSDSTKKKNIDTTTYLTEEVIIKAVRADDNLPITQTTLQLKEIEKSNFGQDMPAFLNNTPSMQFYSDNGLNTGYGYMRLRGMDQTRLNYTLNGVSLSDGEDQGVYFSNFTDFLNSVQSIQIQRGVGLSSNGSASYAGSINFESINLNQKPEFQFNSSLGSYNSHRIATEYNTGKLSNNLAFYGRYSTSASDGYREHSGTAGNSFFFSGGYLGKKHIVKITGFSGNVENDMAYLATPISMINTNRRANVLSPDEKDRFKQSLIMLQSSHFLSPSITLNNSIYYGRAGGDYDVKFDSVTMANYQLSSNQYGLISALEINKNNLKINTGINLQAFNRNHKMGYRPFVSNYDYSNTGFKNEASAFLRANYKLSKFNFMLDLQGRAASFEYQPETKYGYKNLNDSWFFFNPKAGINYMLNEKANIYTSIGKTNREPTRNDLFAGYDNVEPYNKDEIGDIKRFKSESVVDFEIGIKLNGKRGFLNLNYYYMQFKNELTPIGQLSMIGLPLRKNVNESYRSGIEIDWLYKITRKISIGNNSTISKNRIKEYLNDSDAIIYKNVSPLLTPSIISNMNLNFQPIKPLMITLIGRYASESFLDNTANKNFQIKEYFISNLQITYEPKPYLTISGFVNNITDKIYYTAGAVSYGESAYFAMAQRNYMLTLTFKY
jgi:iron complex outermembrane receptor protein